MHRNRCGFDGRKFANEGLCSRHWLDSDRGNGLQQGIPDRVAEGVVHGLEVIEVEEEHGAGFAPAAAGDRDERSCRVSL